MKYINKLFMAGAMVASLSLGSCVGDLDQLPEDSRTLTPAQFKENPREYLGGTLAKCYAGLAISGQYGAGSSDIGGLDYGASCYTRAIFMLNEFTTDECSWIWKDSGIFDLVTDTWSTNNVNIFGTYSRLYCHIAVCNDFLRLTSPSSLSEYEISIGGSGDTAISQAEIDQFRLEARALRDLSYYYVLDLYGNGAYAWDTKLTGEEPPYMKRADLFNVVVTDLEDVLANFPDNTPVYGRIGKDAVEALLCKLYLNAEVFTGQGEWQKCWDHCQNIIARHDTNANHGLAADYLSLFCANNDIFAPGGALAAEQNEILWNVPYAYELTESYGGTTFLIQAACSDDIACPSKWFGVNTPWGCMHARQQFSEKFNFSNGVSNDLRTYIWVTDQAGFNISNNDFTSLQDGYIPMKFTNLRCNEDGTMPRWTDPQTGLNRIGVHDINDVNNNYGISSVAAYADTDYPMIRLAEIYLTAAEAQLRGNVGDRTKALDYINYVRTRAGVPTFGSSEFTLANVLDERCRELYWENNRRTDLVRFGQFAGNTYNWNWKNNVALGAEIPEHMNLFPLPTSVINSYAGPFPQNPGY